MSDSLRGDLPAGSGSTATTGAAIPATLLPGRCAWPPHSPRWHWLCAPGNCTQTHTTQRSAARLRGGGQTVRCACVRSHPNPIKKLIINAAASIQEAIHPWRRSSGGESSNPAKTSLNPMPPPSGTPRTHAPLLLRDALQERALDGFAHLRRQLHPVARNFFAHQDSSKLADVDRLRVAHMVQQSRDELRVLGEAADLVLCRLAGLIVRHQKVLQQKLQILHPRPPNWIVRAERACLPACCCCCCCPGWSKMRKWRPTRNCEGAGAPWSNTPNWCSRVSRLRAPANPNPAGLQALRCGAMLACAYIYRRSCSRTHAHAATYVVCRPGFVRD